MAKFLALVTLVLVIVAVPLSVYSGVTNWRIYQRTAQLRLADDANTPELKAKYLGEYIAALESQPMPAHGGFIFKTERNRVSNQLDVLRSLKKRCDDLAAVDPSSLGYAQGMEQITDQEFEGALASTGAIIADAMWVQAGWFAAYGWTIWVPVVLCGMASLFVASPTY